MSSAPEPRRVVVVVPWYRERPSADERLSLRHLLELLGERDIRIVKPESLPGTLAGRPTESFPDRCFDSVESYSRLLLSADFYRRFAAWDHLLVHQLDALVLGSDLEPWLERPWDYVGAPWLVDADDPSRGFSHAGNGGFCLRRVEACLRVLEHGRPPPLAAALSTTRLPDQRHRPFPRRFAKTLRVLAEARRGVAWYTAHYSLNEDRFWSERARLFDRDFRIAPPAEALRFAVERAPRLALELTDGELPLGVHAWAKHDRTLWEPYLLESPGTAERGAP